MIKLLPALFALTLAACGQVANVAAFEDGGCRSTTHDTTAKVQHFRTEDGDVVRCTIEFRKIK